MTIMNEASRKSSNTIDTSCLRMVPSKRNLDKLESRMSDAVNYDRE